MNDIAQQRLIELIIILCILWAGRMSVRIEQKEGEEERRKEKEGEWKYKKMKIKEKK